MNARPNSRPDPDTQALQQMRAHACEASGLLKAMGNEQRLLILCQLVGGEASVGELLSRSELGQSALSQHLAVLREGNLVQARRVGPSVRYSLPPGPVHRIMQALHAIYCAGQEPTDHAGPPA